MFEPKFLNEIDFSRYERIGIAYSGGLDSSVLLHSLSLIQGNKEKLFALHVNHGISSKSGFWEKHCKETCASLDIKFKSFKLDFTRKEKLNEKDLREARYKELFSWLKEGDVLCTAHHKDDQLETIFFRILRGTGIKGLEGIKKLSVMRNIDLVRPLLDFSKEDLIDYAKVNKLSWIEDESNNDLSIRRNYLRKEVLPLLNKKWPQYSSSLINLSSQAKDSQLLLEEIADSDIKSCLENSSDNLSILKMDSLSKERKKNLIYRWLSQLTGESISSSFVEQIYRNIFLSKKDSNTVISFGNPGSKGSFQLRKFDDQVYFLPLLRPVLLEVSDSWEWNINSRLVLPTGILTSKKVYGKGLSYEFSHKSLLVKARSGGERCKPFGRSKSQKLKKLLQEYKVPPWLRDRLPLIFIRDELVAVSDLWVCEEFVTGKDKAGFVLNWSDDLEQTLKLQV